MFQHSPLNHAWSVDVISLSTESAYSGWACESNLHKDQKTKTIINVQKWSWAAREGEEGREEGEKGGKVKDYEKT